ncbi:MlaD family protein [Leptothoe kymatousa]|uniref:MCE family protein n=1 Tax=Leptothoe kymatousa TAU-MAC 1615 TaxID=2364775 RepID=A0ABS5Y4H4_9CYAN|nr:MlaD family protein [Leptothoe kymatousa]MBT9312712.1 MCE family protein [Leptothoe kymatousa TAU-MAC 1615]
MRARTIREGSVGLLILAGVALFGGLVMWLRGLTYGQRSYRLLVNFDSANGIQEGAAVSYRGVPVGQIAKIAPGSNTVTVEIEINRGDLRIPANSIIKTSQSGLIGETTVSIQPALTDNEIDDSMPGPVNSACNSDLILCNGDQVKGLVGVNYEDLLESSQKISDALSRTLEDPNSVDNLRQILENTSAISGNVVDLTDEVTLITRDLRTQIQPLSASAQQTLVTVSGAAEQLEASAERTSAQLDQTLTQVNALLATNQDNLTTTLDNISASTGQLRLAMDTLSPVIQDGTLVENIELLASNAAIASQDLRTISSTLGTSENLVLLQQTIESARDVFQSAQKIMADVDTLTGDPALRDQVRSLLMGLSDLVSFTGELENQTEVASDLVSFTGELENQTEVAAEFNQQLQQVAELENALASPEDFQVVPDATTAEAFTEIEPTSEFIEAETVGANDAEITQPSLVFNGERYITDLADRP